MIEMFNIVVFIGIVVVLDIYVVFFYCGDQYCVGYGMVQRCGIEIGQFVSCIMESVVLNCCDFFCN